MGAALAIVSEQATLLIVLGAFFLFARFRFADIFIRYSVRITLASTLAVLLILVFQSSTLGYVATLTKFPVAVQFFATSVLAAGLFLAFISLDRHTGVVVNRWLFQVPDYRQAAQQFGETLAQLYHDSEIVSAAKSRIRTTLELGEVRLMSVETLSHRDWPIELRNGEVLELDATILYGAPYPC